MKKKKKTKKNLYPFLTRPLTRLTEGQRSAKLEKLNALTGDSYLTVRATIDQLKRNEKQTPLYIYGPTRLGKHDLASTIAALAEYRLVRLNLRETLEERDAQKTIKRVFDAIAKFNEPVVLVVDDFETIFEYLYEDPEFSPLAYIRNTCTDLMRNNNIYLIAISKTMECVFTNFNLIELKAPLEDQKTLILYFYYCANSLTHEGRQPLPIQNPDKHVSTKYTTKLTQSTKDFNGADLKELVQLATEALNQNYPIPTKHDDLVLYEPTTFWWRQVASSRIERYLHLYNQLKLLEKASLLKMAVNFNEKVEAAKPKSGEKSTMTLIKEKVVAESASIIADRAKKYVERHVLPQNDEKPKEEAKAEPEVAEKPEKKKKKKK